MSQAVRDIDERSCLNASHYAVGIGGHRGRRTTRARSQFHRVRQGDVAAAQ